VESGFGAWPLGLALLQSLTGENFTPYVEHPLVVSTPSSSLQETV
jgi:hypothetical protein